MHSTFSIHFLRYRPMIWVGSLLWMWRSYYSIPLCFFLLRMSPKLLVFMLLWILRPIPQAWVLKLSISSLLLFKYPNYSIFIFFQLLFSATLLESRFIWLKNNGPRYYILIFSFPQFPVIFISSCLSLTVSLNLICSPSSELIPTGLISALPLL